jgi:hypothetical protein
MSSVAAQNRYRLQKKWRVFRRLGKRPRTISFAVDSADKWVPAFGNLPVEGRIPDAI